MCLILFAYKSHPKYQLIVGANRDEFYRRATAPASFWEDEPQILAGRDLEKMGTWMGVDRTGRFAALTNYRDPKESTEGKRTRGELVADFLKGTADARSYLQKAALSSKEYPGYNLLAGDQNELFYFSNKGTAVEKINPGVHGISNHLLNTAWPKVELGKAGLTEIIKKQQPSLIEEIFQLLENTDAAPDESLPATGVSHEWEKLLSPMFIKSEAYGTRSSTVILMAADHILFSERVFKNGTEQLNQEFILTLDT